MASQDEYLALVRLLGDEELHTKVTVMADSLAEAKRLIEADYGEGSIASLWNETQARLPR